MKRRTFLTGIGGSVGGVGFLGVVNSTTCSTPTLSNGVYVQSITQASIQVQFDGYTIKSITWEVRQAKIIGRITVQESCGKHSEPVSIPSDAESKSEMYLQAILAEEAVTFGRFVRNSDNEWVVLYSNQPE